MRFSKGTTLSRHVTEYVNSAGICCLQTRSQSASLCIGSVQLTRYTEEDPIWQDQANVMLPTHPSVFEATSGEMSTVWVGSVDTLISMMRSPLYSTSKCTAGRRSRRSVSGSAVGSASTHDAMYPAERCPTARMLRAMSQLLLGSHALWNRIASINKPSCHDFVR